MVRFVLAGLALGGVCGCFDRRWSDDLRVMKLPGFRVMFVGVGER
jgi:hypothetical protein